MNGIEIIILIALVLLLAAGIGYYMTKDQPSLKQMKQDYQDNEQAQEMVQLAKELHIKDLRPIAVKKAPREVKQDLPQGIVEPPTKQEVSKSVKNKTKYYPKKK